MDILDIGRYRGEFFRVLQQTERSQTAVMTIPGGEDAGPERRTAPTRSSTSWKVRRCCASTATSAGPAPERSS